MNNIDLTRLNGQIRCGEKRSYATEGEAERAAQGVFSLFRSKQWAYRCIFCGDYHLTTKNPTRQARIERGLKSKGII